MTYTPKIVLVTGGLGFIGSNFINHILENYSDVLVINLDAHTYAASKDNILVHPDSNRYILVNGNIADEELVRDILNEYSIDTIINFAAESHVDRSISSPKEFINTNIYGTFVLLEEAKKYWLENSMFSEKNCRFIHISTDEVFGSCKTLSDPSFTEDAKYEPRSPYSASKASSDHIVSAYYHTYGLPIIITNCTNNYGPRQHIEKFIPKVITSCIQRKKIPIYGNGTNVRDWLYVSDHCYALDLLLKNGMPGESYNISGNNELSNVEVVKKICEIMDQILSPPEPSINLLEYVADRAGHDWRYSLCSNKIKQTIGWTPKTDFSMGLRSTIDFYKEKMVSYL